MRARVAALAAEGQPLGHEMLGIELGYRYSRSPVISGEAGVIESTIRQYQPSAAPGARLPHLWTAIGPALHDLLGAGFTLLNVGVEAADASSLALAFRECGTPFELLHIADGGLLAAYEKPLLLVRPDLHVAWRGERLPSDVVHLAKLVTGHVADATGGVA